MLEAYVTNLGRYNEGHLDGEFLKLPAEKADIQELLDKKLWAVPDRIKDKAAFEENINKSIREYNPDYWRTRQTGLGKIAAKQTAPTHNAER